jgi:hypothetical protein
MLGFRSTVTMYQVLRSTAYLGWWDIISEMITGRRKLKGSVHQCKYIDYKSHVD